MRKEFSLFIMKLIKKYLKILLMRLNLINKPAFQFPNNIPSLRFDDDNTNDVRLNIFLPRLLIHAATGGPNTVYQVGARCTEFAKVRFISCFGPDDKNFDSLKAHVKAIVPSVTQENISFESGIKKNKTIKIGKNDVFMGTFWSTADIARKFAGKYGNGKFIYLIQDFEPGFYPWSTNYANALHTYESDCYAIVNEEFLSNYLKSLNIGVFADKTKFENRAISFWPAVDSQFFLSGKKN